MKSVFTVDKLNNLYKTNIKKKKKNRDGVSYNWPQQPIMNSRFFARSFPEVASKTANSTSFPFMISL